MIDKLTNEQKDEIIKALREHGTILAGATHARVSKNDIVDEMRESIIFNKRVLEALKDGQQYQADTLLSFVLRIAIGEIKAEKSQLIAALAYLNAYQPGFKPSAKVEGHFEHDVKVYSSVPRPPRIESKMPPIITVKPHNVISNKDKGILKLLSAGKIPPLKAGRRKERMEHDES